MRGGAAPPFSLCCRSELSPVLGRQLSVSIIGKDYRYIEAPTNRPWFCHLTPTNRPWFTPTNRPWIKSLFHKDIQIFVDKYPTNRPWIIRFSLASLGLQWQPTALQSVGGCSTCSSLLSSKTGPRLDTGRRLAGVCP